MSTTDDVFKVISGGLELIIAGQTILGQIYALQQKRKAEGKELTVADLGALMDAGDIAAANEKAILASAIIKQMTD